MTGYRLVVDRYLHLRTDGKGKVTYKKRYFKGDVIPDLKEAEYERLLAIGAVVAEGEDDSSDDETTDTTDTTDAEGGDGNDDGDVDDNTDDETENTGDPLTSPDYESMTYVDLQHLAKQRDLPAGGTKEDLIVRLVDADNER